MTAPEVRELAAGETEAIVALWEAAGLTRPWNPPHADVALALAGPSSTILGIDVDDELVATALVGHDGHRGWLYYVAVAQPHRGTGLARAIVTAGERWLAARGIRKVQLMVRDGNPAVSLYQHLGYELQATSVLGRWLDA
ncbi:GNAT family acetyltransferase [Agrococcus sp. SGAir0287]|uniref:GNAT family acetyltransferase n=1 Tax=Agrococcus sp. SGAir0287 TaxID=2070347 RepID=UPI0010CD0D1D|nr:GNAT family acetyltransferase [Agrococcus sp. SGAir0287]QCR19092.1 GNAT family acetyltransferase [Agrococcus sp. SGAir0287]